MRCFFPSRNPEDFDAHVDWLQASGALTIGDADTVREFSDFLRAVGKERPIPLSVLREFKEFLGLSDVELSEIERKRAPESG